MAYCNNCGAYIPDGQTKCLACGYDPAGQAQAEQKKSASEYQKERAEERKQAEQDRRRKIEEDRRWAEQEYARRRKEKADAFVARAKQYEGKSASSPNKLFSILSYISILWVLPFIFCPEDESARFHAKQGLSLFIFGAIADVLNFMQPIGGVLTLMRIYLVIKGISNAANGRTERLPWIGKYADK